MTPFTPNPLPLKKELKTQKVLKKAIQSNRALTKLNSVAQMIPNQNILINSLVLQEEKIVLRYIYVSVEKDK